MTATQDTTAPRTFEDAQVMLAASLPGYTKRPHQMRLGAAIEQAIADDRPIMAQAGCGIGKSFAGLIPAILSGRRVIVATATKALQDQYEGDLKFLQEHLGVDFKWAVIKGRSNYPCMAKIADIKMPTRGQDEIIRELLSADARWTEELYVADREKLPLVTSGEWAAMSMGSGECPGKRECPLGEKGLCWAERAKDKANAAQVVITNMAYLMVDMKLREVTGGTVSLLGDYDLLLADEAHNLPEAVTSALSDSMGLSALERIATDAAGYLQLMERHMGLADDVARASVALWQELEAGYRQFKGSKKFDEPMPLGQAMIVRQWQDQFVSLSDALSALGAEVDRTRPDEPKTKIAKARLLRRLGDWAGRLMAVIMDSDADTCRWLEMEEFSARSGKIQRLMLHTAPINIGPWMRENVWERTDRDGDPEPLTVILMSATLAAGKNFGYLGTMLGLLPGEPVLFDAGSPFDFATQARLFIPTKDDPAPNGQTTQEWKTWAREVTRHMVLEAGGGALLLFTSRTAMNESYRLLGPAFEAAGLRVLVQNGEMPNSQMLKIFKEDEDSVLFGLKTFMEGVDVKGRSLRLVVLDKLPFAVPTDVLYQARCSAIDRRGGRSFNEMTVPQMTLVLTQAAGRLIRHRDDRGVVAVLDSRLKGKGYGNQILTSLPPMPQLTDPRQAASFLKEA